MTDTLPFWTVTIPHPARVPGRYTNALPISSIYLSMRCTPFLTVHNSCSAPSLVLLKILDQLPLPPSELIEVSQQPPIPGRLTHPTQLKPQLLQRKPRSLVKRNQIEIKQFRDGLITGLIYNHVKGMNIHIENVCPMSQG